MPDRGAGLRVRIYLCGVRGSTTAPGAEFVRYGGHTSCVAVASGDDGPPRLVLDAGTGLRRVTGLLRGKPFDGTIILTHLHWDHVHGLPFFGGGDRADARVTLLLPEQQARVSDGHSALAYIPDHCPTALGPGPDGWGEYHPAALGLADGVDLLIHDAFLNPEEVAALASFGHPAADYAVGLGRRAGARQVLLAHHKPDRTDDALDQMAARFAADPRVTVGVEGQVLDL